MKKKKKKYIYIYICKYIQYIQRNTKYWPKPGAAQSRSGLCAAPLCSCFGTLQTIVFTLFCPLAFILWLFSVYLFLCCCALFMFVVFVCWLLLSLLVLCVVDRVLLCLCVWCVCSVFCCCCCLFVCVFDVLSCCVVVMVGIRCLFVLFARVL